MYGKYGKSLQYIVKRSQEIYDTIVWNLKFKQANEDDKKITMNKQWEV